MANNNSQSHDRAQKRRSLCYHTWTKAVYIVYHADTKAGLIAGGG